MLQLKVGQVFRLWCPTCRPEPKFKLFVVAWIEPRPRYFLINSHAAAFQLDEPALKAHQLTAKLSENSFLHHDSVLDTSQVFGGPTASELEDLFHKNPNILLGDISVNLRRAARHAIEHSEVLSKREIETLLGAW